jgi:hypothetical protein
MQEILDLCDKLGTEYVMDMIQHEKRVFNSRANSIGSFWAEKDRRDEEDFNRTSPRGQSEATVSRRKQTTEETRDGI